MNQYTEDYFLRGRESGLSLYENYRWMEELTVPMCGAIARHCGMTKDDCVVDFGCARGYTVKALRGLGYEAFGVDVSEWAVQNCDPDVRDYCYLVDQHPVDRWADVDWIVAKDVLEHVDGVVGIVSRLMDAARVGVFAVVPLAETGATYDVPDYEKDVTHLHRFRLAAWVDVFVQPGWSVDARYRVSGVKDNYAQYPTGNGFITARRL